MGTCPQLPDLPNRYNVADMTNLDKGDAPELLTHAEAAARIGISTKTLDRYAAKGIVIPKHLPSGYRRYSIAQIDGLLTAGRRTK